jgi:hypothetical protein
MRKKHAKKKSRTDLEAELIVSGDQGSADTAREQVEQAESPGLVARLRKKIRSGKKRLRKALKSGTKRLRKVLKSGKKGLRKVFRASK